jgi:methylglutaconyl-CoA hydratase
MEPVLVQYTTIPGAVLLTLNRAEQRNALNDELIAQFTSTLRTLDADAACRVVLLTGAGAAFCAGADLATMRALGQDNFKANLQQATHLAEMFALLHALSKPTIAVVNGAAVGGGVGLVAACDLALASESASFRLPEVQLGIAPAMVAPYVIAAIGQRAAARLFFSGESLTARHATQIGLVHEVIAANQLMATAMTLAEQVLKGGPVALSACKRLLQSPLETLTPQHTANLIAKLRAGAEAQQGLSAALEKHLPYWRQ